MSEGAAAAAAGWGGGGRGRVLLPKGWRWDRAIGAQDRTAILERAVLLPAWADSRLEAQNLDVRKLEGSDGFHRLRVGDYRVLFQIFGADVVIHRVGPRASVYENLDALALVRAGDGLRPLRTEAPPPPPAPTPRRPPVRRPARFEPVPNPLSPFTDDQLLAAGLTQAAVDALRRVPDGLVPDEALAELAVEPKLIRLIAEVWEQPGEYLERLDQGASLDLELVRLEEEEAAARIAADLSATSLLSVRDAAQFAALLERPVEDWMVYLHPVQRRAVKLSGDGPVRIRGGAGTGKTVVGLHRARRLAAEADGRVLLTTFVNTLPKVWEGLFATFAPGVRARIDMRTVDSLALSVYKEGGGACEPVEFGQKRKLVGDLHARVGRCIRGLSSYELEEEFDYVLSGRSLDSLDDYLRLPRTGRGSPLPAAAREIVWELFGQYRQALASQGRIAWEDLRYEALQLIRTGRVRRSFDAVVVDEAQDLTETSVRLLVELAGGLPSPRLTIVGDGQQSIYPGGFSLLSLGIDVRGRSVVLRTNWRNTYAIWMAAQALIRGERFDDLEEEDAVLRDEAESPYPLRNGRPARLHVVTGDDRDEAEWLAALVAEDLENGADPGDCAAVHPFNRGVDRLESALKKAGVPVEPLVSYDGRHRPLVRVGTFHRIKGLEFKRVYVAGLAAGRWPLLLGRDDPVTREENRARQVRAAFVAMTRARDFLDVVVGGAPAAELERARWAFDE